jgi:uncharacterized protein
MPSFLPFFPLGLVIYPHGSLNLHIFEPRYRQLVNEVIDEGKTFGIPSFINNKIKGYGTEIQLVSVDKRYEDGRLDIKTKGLRTFRIVDFQNPVPGKLYAGGEVEFIETDGVEGEISEELLRLVQKLHDLLKVTVNLKSDSIQPYSFQVAQKLGLNLVQEYQLLTLPTEAERQAFLIEHLYKVIPTLIEIERTKEIIKMNGHFKNLDPLSF